MNSKGWLQSKTIIGILLLLVEPVSQTLNIPVEDVSALLQAGITMTGAVLAVWGRVAAKTSISPSPIT